MADKNTSPTVSPRVPSACALLSQATGRTISDLTGGILHDAIFRSGEPEWLGQTRAFMFDRFRETGLPTLGDEDWRGTDLRGTGILDLPIRFAYQGEENTPIVLEGKKDGVIFSRLSDAVRDHPELVRSYLFSAYPIDKTPALVALNSACVADGAFGHLPAGEQVDGALRFRFSMDSLAQTTCPHNVFVAAEGSSGTFVEEFSSAAQDMTREAAADGRGIQPAFANSVTEVFVGPGAHLDVLTLVDWADPTRSCHRAVAHVAEGGCLRWYLGTAGGEMVRVDVEISLDGRGAESHIIGMGLGEGGRHLDHRTVQHHACGETTSRITFGTLLPDRSTSIYRGLIRMEPGAIKSDAYQKNDNLLLGRGPEAQAIPMLEILADDVRCSHGSTVGRLTDEDIFYMTSRGIPESEARRLTAEGFIRRQIASGGDWTALSEELFNRMRDRFRGGSTAPDRQETLEGDHIDD